MTLQDLLFLMPKGVRRHRLVKLIVKLYPNLSTQRIKFNDGATLIADISDSNPRQCMLTQQFETDFFKIVAPFLTPAGHFFDVGANFGFYSFGTLGAQSLPLAKQMSYHMFEANPRLHQFLLQSAGLYPGADLHIHHCCVTDKEGCSKLNIVKEQLGMSFISGSGDLEVTNLVLDHYLANPAIETVSFMKIDIEGWEPYALEGARRSMETGKVKALYIEISPNNLSRNGFTPEHCLGQLRSMGFNLFFCRDRDLISDPETYVLNDQQLILKQLHHYPPDHQTDILGVHHSLPLYRG